jgi:hypothetical protein
MTRGNNLRLSIQRAIVVALALLAWSGGKALAQDRVIGITGNLSVERASLASRAEALNETIGIGDERLGRRLRNRFPEGADCGI